MLASLGPHLIGPPADANATDLHVFAVCPPGLAGYQIAEAVVYPLGVSGCEHRPGCSFGSNLSVLVPCVAHIFTPATHK